MTKEELNSYLTVKLREWKFSEEQLALTTPEEKKTLYAREVQWRKSQK